MRRYAVQRHARLQLSRQLPPKWHTSSWLLNALLQAVKGQLLATECTTTGCQRCWARDAGENINTFKSSHCCS